MRENARSYSRKFDTNSWACTAPPPPFGHLINAPRQAARRVSGDKNLPAGPSVVRPGTPPTLRAPYFRHARSGNRHRAPCIYSCSPQVHASRPATAARRPPRDGGPPPSPTHHRTPPNSPRSRRAWLWLRLWPGGFACDCRAGRRPPAPGLSWFSATWRGPAGLTSAIPPTGAR